MDLEARIERLERHNGWLRLGVMALAGVIGVGALVGAKPVEIGIGKPLEFRDDDGKVRGRWTTEGLSLLGKDGKPRIMVSESLAEDSILFFGKNGKTRIELSSTANGCGLYLHDAKGRKRAILVCDNEGTAGLAFLDEKGKVIEE